MAENVLCDASVEPCGQRAMACEKLRDVTLIVHCRQPVELCEQRRPLLLEYSRYFKELIFFLNYKNSWPETRLCQDPGDPYGCVAKEMSKSNASGMLYMQFDVGISPCALAEKLDLSRVANFEAPWYTSFDDLDNCDLMPGYRRPDCRLPGWSHWFRKHNKTRNQLLKAANGLAALQKQLSVAELPAIEKLRLGVWRAMSDLYYIPKSDFMRFAAYASSLKDALIADTILVVT